MKLPLIGGEEVSLIYARIKSLPQTCHACGEEISTGHRLDGDTGLALQEARDEQQLHVFHHTGEAQLTCSHRWSLGQQVFY